MHTKNETSRNDSREGRAPTIRRWPRRLAIALTAFILVATLVFVGFVIYASQYYHDADTEHTNLVSTAEIPVEQANNFLAFGDPSAEVGFVFYPGAKVEYSAYSPLMRSLAERGYLAVVVEMPFNFAFFGIDAADGVRAAYPQVNEWWIGGHSLGGSMAAQYAASHASSGDKALEGLVLLASYTASDLSDSALGAVAVYGSEDSVLNRQKLLDSEALMPEGAEITEIAGGNHALFGNYGAQEGDGTANITAEEQRNQTVDIIDTYIKTRVASS